MGVGVPEGILLQLYYIKHTTAQQPKSIIYWQHMLQIVFKIDLGGRLKCLQMEPQKIYTRGWFWLTDGSTSSYEQHQSL